MDLALPVPVTFSSLFGGRDSASRCWRRALAVSVALHGLILGMVAQHHIQSAKLLDMPFLVVLTRPAAPPAAAPEVPPSPLRAEHPRSSPNVIRASEDLPVTPSVPARPVVDESAPAVPTLAPAPLPAPTPVANREMPDTAALAGFNRALSQAVERQRRYPRIALTRHWQGTAVLKLNIGADGRLQNYLLASSSGHDSLGQQALEMLRDALPLPVLPAQLAGLDLSIDIPVTFRIAD